MSKDKLYKETLAEWRRKHFKEMDIDIAKLITIRDTEGEIDAKCPECKHKFIVSLNPVGLMKMQIEAIKAIARHLGVLAPEKIEKKDTPKEKEPQLTGEDNKKLNTLLKETLGDSWTGLKKDT